MEITRSYNFDFDFEEERIERITNIKSGNVRQITAYLLDNWVCQQTSKASYMFFKHVQGKKQNTLIQVILSGDDYDGLYLMSLKGKKFNTGYRKDEFNNIVLEIHSKGNYDQAIFNGRKPEGFIDMSYNDNGCSGYVVIRSAYDTEEHFINALVGTGLVTKEEINIYRKNRGSGIKNKTYVVMD